MNWSTFQGLVIPFTAVILQNILISTVSCNYHIRPQIPPWDLKNNCEPFQFCPNKGPSNLPKLCSRNGGYPDDLTYENTNYANYSQYRAALALRPCFSTEMANMGIEGEDYFRIIEVFSSARNWRVGRRCKREHPQHRHLKPTAFVRHDINISQTYQRNLIVQLQFFWREILI